MISKRIINFVVLLMPLVRKNNQKSFSYQMLSKFTHRTAQKVSAERLPYYRAVSPHCSQVSQFPAKILLLVNSLSLDAPFVAITWLWCFSTRYSTKVEIHDYFILFSVTWLAYLGDRLLDSLRLPDAPERTPRHRFTREFFWPLLICWGLVALISTICLFELLTKIELVWGFGLLFVLAIYFLSCFYIPKFARGLLPRELLVGMFFSLATHFFIWSQVQSWDNGFIWTFNCFLFLCTLNCLCISRWEYQTDRQAGEVSFFTRHPDLMIQVPYFLTGFIMFQLCICSYAIAINLVPVFEISMISSSLILLILDRRSINHQLKPVLADCALLTPCLYLSLRI
ncbi:MAG TPA: hypothetical protein DCM07_21320 [Planctomycetaceae bacterium]|nr:hypothetical protein [Gimesia sp.]HAH47351.1 hypothetical protein [Planctomycetaceae bacterium]